MITESHKGSQPAEIRAKTGKQPRKVETRNALQRHAIAEEGFNGRFRAAVLMSTVHRGFTENRTLRRNWPYWRHAIEDTDRSGKHEASFGAAGRSQGSMSRAARLGLHVEMHVSEGG